MHEQARHPGALGRVGRAPEAAAFVHDEAVLGHGAVPVPLSRLAAELLVVRDHIDRRRCHACPRRLQHGRRLGDLVHPREARLWPARPVHRPVQRPQLRLGVADDARRELPSWRWGPGVVVREPEFRLPRPCRLVGDAVRVGAHRPVRQVAVRRAPAALDDSVELGRSELDVLQRPCVWPAEEGACQRGHVVRHAVPQLLEDGLVGVVLEVAPRFRLPRQPFDVNRRRRSNALEGRGDCRHRRQPERPRAEIPLPRAYRGQHRLIRDEEVCRPHPPRRSPVAVLGEGEASTHLASPVRHPLRPARVEQVVEVAHGRVTSRLHGRRARFHRRHRRVHPRHRPARELHRRRRRVAAQREGRALPRARDPVVVELEHVRVIRADVQPKGLRRSRFRGRAPGLPPVPSRSVEHLCDREVELRRVRCRRSRQRRAKLVGPRGDLRMHTPLVEARAPGGADGAY